METNVGRKNSSTKHQSKDFSIAFGLLLFPHLSINIFSMIWRQKWRPFLFQNILEIVKDDETNRPKGSSSCRFHNVNSTTQGPDFFTQAISDSLKQIVYLLMQTDHGDGCVTPIVYCL